MKSSLPGSSKFSVRHGVLLLEAALGTGLLAIFLGALGLTMYNGQQETKAGIDRIAATKIAEQSMEGARDIGARNFAALWNAATGAPKGVVMNTTSNLWELSGPSSVDGIYTSVLTITKPDPADANTVDLSVTTSWSVPQRRPQSVTIKSRFTNWRQKKNVGNWGAGIVPLGQYNGSGQNFNDVAVINSTAYVSNITGNNILMIDVAGAGPGNPAMPLVGTLPLTTGHTPVAVAAKGTVLYVITTNGGSSYLSAYNAAVTPPTLPALVAGPQAIPLVNGMAATSLVISGDFLYLGAK